MSYYHINKKLTQMINTGFDKNNTKIDKNNTMINENNTSKMMTLIKDDSKMGTKRGNTKPISPSYKKNENIENTRFRQWVFTLNNYSNEEYNNLINYFNNNSKIKDYIVGKEIGEKGTSHLQGYFVLKNATTFNVVNKLCKRWHIEKAKGTANENYSYCSKDNDYVCKRTNYKIKPYTKKVIEKKLSNEEWTKQLYKFVLKEEYDNVKWKTWQKTILNIINDKPDKRSIYWVYDEEGNKGKSYLCKYIDLINTTENKGVIIANGTYANIANQTSKCLEDNIMPYSIICDIPRNSIKFCNINSLESLKNGHMYSGKYEGAKIIIPAVHVVIFSNEMPDITDMSIDRWNIFDLNKNKVIKYYYDDNKNIKELEIDMIKYMFNQVLKDIVKK